jgi:hypothetical protein
MRLSASPVNDEILREQGQTRLARGLARLRQSLCSAKFQSRLSILRSWYFVKDLETGACIFGSE